MARVTTVLAVVASLAIVAPAARAAEGCDLPSGAQVRAKAEHAIVYKTGARVYACLRRTGDRVLLERVGRRGDRVTRVGPIALAGSHVAYAKQRIGADPGSFSYVQVVHIDLRHPGSRHGEGTSGDVGPPSVGRIVLAPDGALAYTVHGYLVEGDSGARAGYRKVVAVDEVGGRILEESKTIDVDSLVRRGRTVSWTSGGETQRAHFRDLGRCSLPRDASVQRYAAGTTVYKVWSQDVTKAFACVGRTGDTQLVNRDVNRGRSEYSDNYRIAGRFVAWSVLVGREGHPDERHLRLYDLRTRSGVHGLIVGSQCGTAPDISDLAVSRAGDLAWIALELPPEDCSGDPRAPSVHAWDACGMPVLDDDPGIDWTSLRIAGTQVRWTVYGDQRSAELRSVDEC